MKWLLTPLLLTLLLASSGAQESSSRRRRGPSALSSNVPAIYNFGDSNSDTGGLSAVFPPTVPPNGETFFHNPSGRACDGRLIIDFIAEHLGMPYLSAYLNSIKPNFEHGANFATRGATIRQQNEGWFQNYVSPFSLDIQLTQFDEFKAQTSFLYKQATEQTGRDGLPKPEEFSKALYMFDIGQNDLDAGFRKMSHPQILADIPNIITLFANAVQHLYGSGARAFWIHNTGPIGCLPMKTVDTEPNLKPALLDEHGCIKNQNDIAKEFNKQLKDRVIKLRAELPQAALTYVDIYTAKYKLISNARHLGFEDASNICCGFRGNGTKIWCGYSGNVNGREMHAGSCPNPSKVISWDSVHYTESANHWIASLIMNGSLSDPPISIAQAFQ
ncbi:GDSL esterase/lipase At5g14450 [Daucus carota subsp. sativus]|uniref:GDSL esterase/lipase At5g14450 n=1 Tax=Daucus carota subsp. sativus TaxID=79200 RepID=UPI0007EF4AAC|nr:PREDICTED: GDSL esterase/lipase At5g14450 [Daucus carota subsp. sativus]